MGLAETTVNKNLTRTELESLRVYFSENNIVSDGIKLYEGKSYAKWRVHNTSAVIIKTLTVLDSTGIYTIKEGRPPEGNMKEGEEKKAMEENYRHVKANATHSLRHVGINRTSKGAGHWQEGDAEGGFLWDSYSGIDECGKLNFPERTRYYTIRKVN